MWRWVESASAAVRQREALLWLSRGERGATTWVVGASVDAPNQLVRQWVHAQAGAHLGVERMSWSQLAGKLALPALVRAGRVAASGMALEALAARCLHRVSPNTLDAIGRVADRPGVPGALARTLFDLRMAHVRDAPMPFNHLLDEWDRELRALGLADRALVFELATQAVREVKREDARVCQRLLLLDTRISSPVECELWLALTEHVTEGLITMPSADDRTRSFFVRGPCASEKIVGDGSLAAWQEAIFSSDSRRATEADVSIFSAPGEGREAIEIARRVLQEAQKGVALDRMAVLLRSPLAYVPHLCEAFRRAGIPAHFADGATRPDASGRAFLSLLFCAREGLSAKRFAEYLSLAQLPDADTQGHPSPPLAGSDRWVVPDVELLSIHEVSPLREDALVRDGAFRAPWKWERFLVDASVIGGLERWEQRLSGLERSLLKSSPVLENAPVSDNERAEGVRRQVEELGHLRAYALPILQMLAKFPKEASWGEWIDRLGAVAARTLRDPSRVVSLLAELTPMCDVGPASMDDVLAVLRRRLCELPSSAASAPSGHIFVGAIERARGLVFDVVFVPGLSERMFPAKVTEDPLLSDEQRRKISLELETNEARAHGERVLLQSATGAARCRVHVSYSRFDAEKGRARTPSFYALELVDRLDGRPVLLEELRGRAGDAARARLGWPAPDNAANAIDEVEFDLAVIGDFIHGRTSSDVLRNRIASNEHSRRAIASRAQRWSERFSRADGLVDPIPEAKKILERHQLIARSFSPTALQHYAACPYRFYLQAIHKFAPRKEPAPLEELGALERGSLIHEIQFELHTGLRSRGWLPVTEERADDVRLLIEQVTERVAKRYEDELHPAVLRVWQDSLRTIAADMREWLRRALLDPTWVPIHFELSVGLDSQEARDPSSQSLPLDLECGIRMRGSIDLIERHSQSGQLRATDYKTGKAWVEDGKLIDGGRSLQPVLYALALERLFPDAEVFGSQLYYATHAGQYKTSTVVLDDDARTAARTVATTIGAALESGFLPAVPRAGECDRCDYRIVCGPYEEVRSARKERSRTQRLIELRSRP